MLLTSPSKPYPSGSIIATASVAGLRSNAGSTDYSASKAAVISLMQTCCYQLAGTGIRCNAICPGTIESPSLDGRIDALAASTGQTRDAVRQAFVDRQPMGRLGTAHEVAMLAVYLASDESRYTTGTIHLVDGGFSL